MLEFIRALCVRYLISYFHLHILSMIFCIIYIYFLDLVQALDCLELLLECQERGIEVHMAGVYASGCLVGGSTFRFVRKATLI